MLIGYVNNEVEKICNDSYLPYTVYNNEIPKFKISSNTDNNK